MTIKRRRYEACRKVARGPALVAAQAFFTAALLGLLRLMQVLDLKKIAFKL